MSKQQKWVQALWWLAPIAGMTVLQYTTETPIPFTLLALLVIFYGGLILDRLPESNPRNSYHSEFADDYLKIRIDNIIEESFEVQFVDGWQTGRSFSLYGNVVCNDQVDEFKEPKRRIEVAIYPTQKWFDSGLIGHSRGGFRIGLPYQIASDLLREVRRDINQLVIVGLKSAVAKDGTQYQAVCSFEMTALQND